MRPRASPIILTLMLIASQLTAQQRPQPTPPRLDADAARAVVDTFLAAEAQNLPDDTLLTPDADFIINGVVVTTRPRLAGINGTGNAAAFEATTSLAGAFAWLVVGYRFSGRTRDLDEQARATFILEKQRAGWRIRHVHSSNVERW